MSWGIGELNGCLRQSIAQKKVELPILYVLVIAGTQAWRKMTDSLYTAKAAVEQGLISQDDYSAVKAAFLRAQQIKAGLDSGFLKPEDYQEVKRAFLQSLESLSLGSPVVQPGEAGQGIAVQQGANGMPQSAQMPAAASRTGMGSSQAAPQQQAPGGGPAGALPPSEALLLARQMWRELPPHNMRWLSETSSSCGPCLYIRAVISAA